MGRDDQRYVRTKTPASLVLGTNRRERERDFGRCQISLVLFSNSSLKPSRFSDPESGTAVGASLPLKLRQCSLCFFPSFLEANQVVDDCCYGISRIGRSDRGVMTYPAHDVESSAVLETKEANGDYVRLDNGEPVRLAAELSYCGCRIWSSLCRWAKGVLLGTCLLAAAVPLIVFGGPWIVEKVHSFAWDHRLFGLFCIDFLYWFRYIMDDLFREKKVVDCA